MHIFKGKFFGCRFLLVLFFLIVTFSNSVWAQDIKLDPERKYHIACVAFYNVENLFDTIDDPKINDEEYLPGSAIMWNTEKYVHKLNRISEVISQIGTEYTPDGAAIIGLCEIENKQVLEDLIKTPLLASRNYKIAHYDSPDRRGIDVAFLYQPKYFTLLSSSAHRIYKPDDPEYFTRDQVLISGELNGERMHLMVAHWPSRRGGETRSAPNRMLAAQVGRNVVDSIFAAEPGAKIVYMGDLNDDPVNKSVTEGLRAKGNVKKLEEGDLFNTMNKFYKDGIGTLAYRDSWNLFDNMIVSQSFLGGDLNTYRFYKSKIFNKPFVRQSAGNFQGYPFRSYVAGRYDGGYSDHFAVYTFFVKEALEN
jgi:hypothetical protein